MKTLWLSLGALWFSGALGWSASSISGCVMPTSTSDAGTTAIPSVSDGGPLSASVTGTGCGTDPTTGVTLCLGTSECSTLTVDQSVFPECGFYFVIGSVYLACLCSNYLCPIGQPATCDQAASLLSSTNEGAVCNAISSNGCTEVSSGTGTTSSDAGSGSGCDETCYASCAGVPDCIQLSGC
jgi:hypothetical protein